LRWLLYGEDEIVGKWVGERIAHANFGSFVSIGLCEDQKLIAAVIYHNYIKEYGNIELSMAADSPRWATPESIGALLHYPFVRLGCNRVTTCTPASNRRALKFNKGIGFIEEGVIRKGYGAEDMVICGLLKEEAQRWLNFNKESSNG